MNGKNESARKVSKEELDTRDGTEEGKLPHSSSPRRAVGRLDTSSFDSSFLQQKVDQQKIPTVTITKKNAPPPRCVSPEGVFDTDLHRNVFSKKPPTVPFREDHSTMVNPCVRYVHNSAGEYDPGRHHSTTASTQHPPPPAPYIEIAPGMVERLRGAVETWDCVRHDAIDPCACACCCTTSLFCVNDAAYVICPHCRVVSPLHDDDVDDDDQRSARYGVGLGFTHIELLQMQHAIVHGLAPPV